MNLARIPLLLFFLSLSQILSAQNKAVEQYKDCLETYFMSAGFPAYDTVRHYLYAAWEKEGILGPDIRKAHLAFFEQAATAGAPGGLVLPLKAKPAFHDETRENMSWCTTEVHNNFKHPPGSLESFCWMVMDGLSVYGAPDAQAIAEGISGIISHDEFDEELSIRMICLIGMVQFERN